MISFDAALEMAKYILGEECRYGFLDIRETEDVWLFFGKRFKENFTVYGIAPAVVNKKNGHCEIVPIFAPGNVGIYLKSKSIEQTQDRKIRVIYQFEVASYSVLKLSEDIPNRKYNAYRIAGREYAMVPVYDMERCIAIEGEGRFIGEIVDFIQKTD